MADLAPEADAGKVQGLGVPWPDVMRSCFPPALLDARVGYAAADQCVVRGNFPHTAGGIGMGDTVFQQAACPQLTRCRARWLRLPAAPVLCMVGAAVCCLPG